MPVELAFGSVVVDGLSEEEESIVDVEAPGAAGDDDESVVVGGVLVAGLLDAAGAPVVGVSICAGVEVEETNGGAFSMTLPPASTA